MPTYTENMYNKLKQKGLASKFEFSGIYCIQADGKILYIGKSNNMLKRMAQHYVGINTESEDKYKILKQLQQQGYRITFDVLYYAQSNTVKGIQEELGEQEGKLIRKYLPPLNTQIPDAEDWHNYEYRRLDWNAVLKRLKTN